jgi:hypothetical protein
VEFLDSSCLSFAVAKQAQGRFLLVSVLVSSGDLKRAHSNLSFSRCCPPGRSIRAELLRGVGGFL